MKVAALDLGSNTFLCLIAEVTELGIEKIYQDHVEVVRLGQGLSQSKNFNPESLKRADTCLKKFSEVILQENPNHILAMATSAARDAVNKDELISLGKKYNIPIEIIPGDKEAEITYQGAVSGFKKVEKNFLIIDIGGGSTEFIFGRGKKRIMGKSFDIGCVRLTEKFITNQPTPQSEIDSVIKYVDESIKQILSLKPHDFEIDTLLAVAGTPTSIAAAEIGSFDVDQIDGFELTEELLMKWLSLIKNSNLDEKIKLGIPEGRADVILIGIIILLRTLVLFNKKCIVVSTRGVRYGVALEIYNRHHH